MKTKNGNKGMLKFDTVDEMLEYVMDNYFDDIRDIVMEQES